ncbi:bacteriorhodopsin-like [Phaeodactylibacter xiamenensis]|jgi:bacteriorhodopsin|uniref:bacteriorhodopsin-like n=1 Tax=Phaeodactylibacter xiamenensis TaxID=1524460 RepID=UPI0005C6D053|nr:bacteriorhodopsin-like [Phaeodactylibacter xiamenensis]MCR9054687.1 bacteriorhodopsin-like [bacterium]
MDALVNIQPLLLAQLKSGDYVGFTFFIGSMAMAAATVFFFFQFSQVKGKWKDSMLVSGLITFIAAVHYFYMRDFWATNQASPTEFRYIDWILTVPLMCVEFYLILRAFGAKVGLLWKMIFYSLVMLVAGYLGETVFRDQSPLWGFISTIGYVGILYEVWFGSAKRLSSNSNDPKLQKGFNALAWFVFAGWAIYPIGYMTIDTGWLAGVIPGESMDIIYNIGDAVNKIGFGLVIYSLAISKSAEGSEESVGVGAGKTTTNA